MATQKAEFKRIIQGLNRGKIEYLVIGGVAVLAYGVERATFDIDVLLPEDEKIIDRFLKVVLNLGYRRVTDEKGNKIGPIARLKPGRVIERKMVRFKGKYDLDLLTISRSKFDFMHEYRQQVEYAGIKIPIPEIIDLIHLKEWSGRPRDKEDARLLRARLRLRKK